MGARYYDPMGGRFLSTDPIGCPININLYAYANGDPINFFDPDGRFHSPVYKTIQPSTFGIRAMGVLRSVGGMAETLGGGAFAMGTAPTGIGLVGGSILMAHGLDNAMTGFRQAFTGQVAESATSQLLQKTGLSQNHASLIDDGIGLFGPMALAIGMVKLEAKAASYSLHALKEAEMFTQGQNQIPKTQDISQLTTKINEWLGKGSRLIKNKANDPIFLSNEGMRRVRFDFNRPTPHNNPHMHLETFVDGEWKGYGQIYPYDVPHN
jgi:hypothetical protein